MNHEEYLTIKGVVVWDGVGGQVNQVIEEASELIHALMHRERGLVDQSVPEEIADLRIALDALEMALECEDEVAAFRREKIRRLEVRLLKNSPIFRED